MDYKLLLQKAMSTLSDIQDRLSAEDEHAIYEMKNEIDELLTTYNTES